jgi:peptidoglycan/xylan/chitin deacetylase (PgdA/CDA1 family)
MRIIATWDDAAKQDLRIAELMAKYKIPTIFYWPCALEKSYNLKGVKEFLSLKECKKIAKSFSVGSHSYNHFHLKKEILNSSQAKFEIFNSRKFWQDETGQSIDTFCYPRGRFDPEYKEMVKTAGYKSARCVAVGSLDEGNDPYETPTTIHVGIKRKEYNELTWIAYARMMIQHAKEVNDPLFHFFGHSWEIEANNEWENLESLLRDLKP